MLQPIGKPAKSEKRVLAAPFQNSTLEVANVQIKDSNDNVDYRNFKFKQLDKFGNITYDTYCGPTPESNWVIPGVLLVGAYPASQDDVETFELITSILKLGITKFVCLQLEYKHNATQEMWRSGMALRPYYHDVQKIVRNKAIIPEFNNSTIVDESKLSFEHCPIVDCGITDDDGVLELSKRLAKAISEGEVLYLHCWGGHGRTGTVVSILLHLMYGLRAEDAMARCQFVHDIRQCPVEVGSPQTQTQRDQVVRIVNKLIAQANSENQQRSRLSKNGFNSFYENRTTVNQNSLVSKSYDDTSKSKHPSIEFKISQSSKVGAQASIFEEGETSLDTDSQDHSSSPMGIDITLLPEQESKNTSSPSTKSRKSVLEVETNAAIVDSTSMVISTTPVDSSYLSQVAQTLNLNTPKADPGPTIQDFQKPPSIKLGGKVNSPNASPIIKTPKSYSTYNMPSTNSIMSTMINEKSITLKKSKDNTALDENSGNFLGLLIGPSSFSRKSSESQSVSNTPRQSKYSTTVANKLMKAAEQESIRQTPTKTNSSQLSHNLQNRDTSTESNNKNLTYVAERRLKNRSSSSQDVEMSDGDIIGNEPFVANTTPRQTKPIRGNNSLFVHPSSTGKLGSRGKAASFSLYGQRDGNKIDSVERMINQKNGGRAVSTDDYDSVIAISMDDGVYLDTGVDSGAISLNIEEKKPCDSISSLRSKLFNRKDNNHSSNTDELSSGPNMAKDSSGRLAEAVPDIGSKSSKIRDALAVARRVLDRELESDNTNGATHSLVPTPPSGNPHSKASYNNRRL